MVEGPANPECGGAGSAGCRGGAVRGAGTAGWAQARSRGGWRGSARVVTSRPPPRPWPWPEAGGQRPGSSAARRGTSLRAPLALRVRLRRPLGPPLPLPRRRPPHVGAGRPRRAGARLARLSASPAARAHARRQGSRAHCAGAGRPRRMTSQRGAGLEPPGGSVRRPPRFAAAPRWVGGCSRGRRRRAIA